MEYIFLDEHFELQISVNITCPLVYDKQAWVDQENEFENICELAAISIKPDCVNANDIYFSKHNLVNISGQLIS